VLCQASWDGALFSFAGSWFFVAACSLAFCRISVRLFCVVAGFVPGLVDVILGCNRFFLFLMNDRAPVLFQKKVVVRRLMTTKFRKEKLVHTTQSGLRNRQNYSNMVESEKK
jgi:hypothetical protein